MKKNIIKRSLATAAVLFVAMLAQAQTVGVFIYDNDGPFTNVRNSPDKGKVVAKIPVDGDAMFAVMSPQNGWWCIAGDSYEILDEEQGDWKEVKLKGSSTGYWIHNSVIAVSTRNYGGQKLQLKQQPAANAAASYTLKGEQLVRPLDVRGEWVKVKTLDGKGQGWLLSEWLCGNSVTTCP